MSLGKQAPKVSQPTSWTKRPGILGNACGASLKAQ
jgi:hypothetical protein